LIAGSTPFLQLLTFFFQETKTADSVVGAIVVLLPFSGLVRVTEGASPAFYGAPRGLDHVRSGTFPPPPPLSLELLPVLVSFFRRTRRVEFLSFSSPPPHTGKVVLPRYVPFFPPSRPPRFSFSQIDASRSKLSSPFSFCVIPRSCFLLNLI